MEKDINQIARNVVEAATEPALISKIMSEMGRRGGLKGGEARKKALTKKRMHEIAMMGVKARQKKRKLKQ
jgi:hypothetical protein